MVNQDIYITRSHLLRRLLQRRVELLEAEKAELRSQVRELEERLSRSAESQVAYSGSTQAVINETMERLRAISEQAQTESMLTMHVTRQEQEKLADEMSAILVESQQLRHMMLEAVEGVNSILERAQNSNARMVKEAHRQEEKLAREFEVLYSEEGDMSPAIVEVRRASFQIRKRAKQVAEQFEAEAKQERQQLLNEIAALHHESVQLRSALTEVLERTRSITERTQDEAEQLVADGQSLDTSLLVEAHVEDPDDADLLDSAAGNESEKAGKGVGDDIFLTGLPRFETPHHETNGHGSEKQSESQSVLSSEEVALQEARDAIQQAQLMDPEPEPYWTRPFRALVSLSSKAAARVGVEAEGGSEQAVLASEGTQGIESDGIDGLPLEDNEKRKVQLFLAGACLLALVLFLALGGLV